MTIAELRAYLAEVEDRIKAAEQHPRGASAETFCAQMWKRFTPEALSLWTTPGVLEHIAQCLSPPEQDEDEDEE
jgi:hypothetical protein